MGWIYCFPNAQSTHRVGRYQKQTGIYGLARNFKQTLGLSNGKSAWRAVQGFSVKAAAPLGTVWEEGRKVPRKYGSFCLSGCRCTRGRGRGLITAEHAPWASWVSSDPSPNPFMFLNCLYFPLNFYWNRVDFQCWVGFRHTEAKWFSYMHNWV